MKYISTKEASVKWDISDRRVRILCAEGKILDVIQVGRAWLIPFDAVKPVDGRTIRSFGKKDSKKSKSVSSKRASSVKKLTEAKSPENTIDKLDAYLL